MGLWKAISYVWDIFVRTILKVGNQRKTKFWHDVWCRENQLKRRECMIPNRCYMCKEEEETMDHILLYYLKAVILWQLNFTLFGIELIHSLIKKVLLSWHECFVGSKRKKAWRISPLYLSRPYGRREIGECPRIPKKHIKHSNNHLCIIFGMG